MPQLILSIQGVEIKRVNLVKNRTTLGRKPAQRYCRERHGGQW